MPKQHDYRGRLLQTDYRVKGNNEITLVPRTVVSAMVYDEAGQLKTKYLHSQNSQAFLQKVDYKYNIRGWLTAINDPQLAVPENDQFGMTLYYNKSSSGTAGYYNGNIQAEKWGVSSYLNQVNTYTYDKLNRITGSKFGTTNSFRTSYSYDLNGNISKLTRRGSTGTYIDSISYGYKYYTNQLDYTSDYYGDAPGWDFPGTLTGSNHYQYDAMGNLTRDDYKAVSVSYNSFNLPSELDFGNNQKLNYIYDGSGQKLTQIYSPGTYYPTNMEYVGQFVHQSRNGTSSLKYIITPEGRLKNTGTNAAPVWGWEYDLKDHLGNVRVSFKPNATNNGVVRNGYANYFPFGMKMLSPYVSGVMSNYLYNGKETQDDFSLNWYDYGARFYDATIGRWNSLDPLAAKYFSLSPYNYVANNPIMLIDPDGKDIRIWYAKSNEYFIFNGTNGNLAPNDAYVQNVIEAYNYDVNNGGGDNLKEAATNPKINIEVAYSPYGNKYRGGGTVFWNPYLANQSKNGLFTSPATGLEHEFDHAVDDALHPKEHKGRHDLNSSKYENMEEKRVITGSERKTAEKNHELKPGQVRDSHEGDYYDVNNPTSTKFEPGLSKDPNNNKEWQGILDSWLRLSKN